MLKYSGLICCLFAGLFASAQSVWNWPENPGQEKLAKEKQAHYKVLMQTEDYQESFNSLMWLYKNVPDLNESIYIDGAKILDKLLEGENTEGRKKVLQDSILWTYDARMKYFDAGASAIDRKAYTAFKMHYKDKKSYPLLLELYEQLFSFEAEVISNYNLAPYMTLAAYYYKSNPEEMPVEKVQEIHNTITNVIDEKISIGADAAKMQKEQDVVDAFLSYLEGTITCEFIEMNLVPKFHKDPDNLKIAKKIFSYSLSAKCTDQPYFVMAGETFYKSKPSFALAKTLADRFYNNNEYEKASDYYTKAEAHAENDDQKFQALYGMASTLSKQGYKSRARAMAYEALSVNPDAREAHNLIGNLYFSSFDECKGGESKVKDRAIFIVAYKMYEKAGNTEQMAASKEQFPSIEEIFNEGFNEKEKITVDCWINESAVLQRRPQ